MFYDSIKIFFGQKIENIFHSSVIPGKRPLTPAYHVCRDWNYSDIPTWVFDSLKVCTFCFYRWLVSIVQFLTPHLKFYKILQVSENFTNVFNNIIFWPKNRKHFFFALLLGNACSHQPIMLSLRFFKSLAKSHNFFSILTKFSLFAK